MARGRDTKTNKLSATWSTGIPIAKVRKPRSKGFKPWIPKPDEETGVVISKQSVPLTDQEKKALEAVGLSPKFIKPWKPSRD